jgi:hypothetical protein
VQGGDKPAPTAGAATPGTSAQREPIAVDAEAARLLWTRWRDFLAVVKTQCGQQAAAALNAVRDVAVAEHSVAFAFGNNEFSRNLIAKPDVLPGVAAALSRFIHRDVTIECQIGEKAVLTGQAVTVQALATDGPDPLVEFAVKDLGAQVAKDGGKRTAGGRKTSPIT